MFRLCVKKKKKKGSSSLRGDNVAQRKLVTGCMLFPVAEAVARLRKNKGD